MHKWQIIKFHLFIVIFDLHHQIGLNLQRRLGNKKIQNQMAKQYDTTINAKVDNYPLATTVFEPESEEKKRVVCVISSATGIKRQFYQSFAEYLCKNYNLTVICYDYRGIGDSGNPKDIPEAGIIDWCRKDMAGVLEYALDKYPTYDLVCVGHSVGAHAHGILYPELNQKVKRVLTVSGNNAHLKYFKWNSTYFMTLVAFFGLRGALSKWYGFYPAKEVFGLMEDLPTNVAYQWAYFMSNPQYFVQLNDHTKLLHPEGFESLTAPILSFSFESDDIASKKGIDVFHERFKNSSKIVRLHYPNEYKAGHVNFFRSSITDKKLWDVAAKFLADGSFPNQQDQPQIMSRL
jgi:predicted alpha/beta hydrolase